MANLKNIKELAKKHNLEITSNYEAEGYLKYLGTDTEDTDYGNAQFTTDDLEMYDTATKEDATHFFVVLSGNHSSFKSFINEVNYTEWLSSSCGGYSGEEVFIFELEEE
jgi:hypothetical protein